MFSWLRRRKENKAFYETGQELGREVAALLNRYFEEALPDLTKSVMLVFRDRLGTIYDESRVPPQHVALVEWSVFLENIEPFSPKVLEHSRKTIPQAYEVLERFGSDFDIVARITQQALVTKDLLIKEAYLELVKVYAEAEKKSPIPNGWSLLVEASTKVPGLTEWMNQPPRAIST